MYTLKPMWGSKTHKLTKFTCIDEDKRRKSSLIQVSQIEVAYDCLNPAYRQRWRHRGGRGENRPKGFKKRKKSENMKYFHV